MMKLILVGLAAASLLAAQTAPASGSVSGVVKDKVSGQPLQGYQVSTYTNSRWVGNTIYQTSATKQVTAATDAAGRYRLASLPAGEYRIHVRGSQGFATKGRRSIVTQGADLEHVDFLVPVDGVIKGRVLDENNEPVPEVTVWLVTKEYFMGQAGYHYAQSGGRTNDLGEYTVADVPADRPFLILAEKVNRNIPALSPLPMDPKLRRLVPVRTWYPNSPDREGAQAVTLRSGETRESVNVEMKRSSSYCIEGVVAGPMGPASLHFGIEPLQPSSGISGSGGLFVASPGGTTGADGKFRVCDLTPGSYRLHTQLVNTDTKLLNFGVIDVTISDRDVRGASVTAMPAGSMAGEAVWEADPPATPITAKLNVSLSPLLRAPFANEQSNARTDVPGPFTLESVLPDDYALRIGFNAAGAYVKDVTFSGHSVMNEPLRPGSAMSGAGLRVILAHDGGTVTAQVNDKDGNPVPDIRVIVIPADIRTEGELAARMVDGMTNQLGQFTSQTLPPGKYYAVATLESVEPTPEKIGRLWRARTHFSEVTVPPNGSTQIRLEPGKIE